MCVVQEMLTVSISLLQLSKVFQTGDSPGTGGGGSGGGSNCTIL